MKKQTYLLLLLSGLIALLASACGAGQQAELPDPTQAREAVRQRLHEETGVDLDQIEIVEAEQVDFEDECLELPGPNEACAEQVTSGWVVEAEVDGEPFVVHTDLDASEIRIEGFEAGMLPPEAEQAQQFLAQQLEEVQVEDIELVSSEQVDWSDACLELGGTDEACAQVVTPGWRFTFEANGERFEVRTDELAENIRLVESTG